MKKILFAVVITAFLGSPAGISAVVDQIVEYKDGETVLEGYLAYDDTLLEKRPAVIVVHEWKGLNDYAKSRARQLAELGYIGFAADIYGKGKRAETHEEAAKLAGMYKSDRNLMRSRARAAFDFIKAYERVDAERIAAIGYCFGGTTVLEMARAGMNLQAVASFHGALDTPMPAGSGQIKSRIAVFHGEEDSFIKEEDIEAFRKEMREAGADWQFIAFGGAVHSFTVPAAGNDKAKGMAYNAKADKRSWAILEMFLRESLT